jgi:hypothetical protein
MSKDSRTELSARRTHKGQEVPFEHPVCSMPRGSELAPSVSDSVQKCGKRQAKVFTNGETSRHQ